MIKTYRGLMVQNEQTKIRLGTPQGKIGYKIKKFQIIPEKPFASGDKEMVMKLYKTEQSSVDADINFGDSSLLAAATYSDSDGSSVPVTQTTETIIFDSEVFNQDIFVTYVEFNASLSGNYYLELEQIKLSEQEALVSIVKNLRTEQ